MQADYKHQARQSTDKEPTKTEDEKKKATQDKDHIRKRKGSEMIRQSQAQKWAFSRKKQAKKPQSPPLLKGTYSRDNRCP